MKRRWQTGLLLGLLVGGAFHGCGDDPTQPPSQLFFPEAWAGAWRLTLTRRDCATDSLLGVDIAEDTICAGESLVDHFDLGGYGVELSCTGRITDTRIDATCTGQLSDCDITLSLSAERADSTISGNGTLRFSACPFAACSEFDIQGRRRGPSPCPAASNGLAVRLLARGVAGREPQDPELRARHERENPPADPERAARNDRN